MKAVITTILLSLFSITSFAGGSGWNVSDSCANTYESDVLDHIRNWNDYSCSVIGPSMTAGKNIVECLHFSKAYKIKNLQVNVGDLASRIKEHVDQKSNISDEQLNLAVQWAVHDAYSMDDCLSNTEYNKKDHQSVSEKIEFLNLSPQAVIDSEVGNVSVFTGVEISDGKRVFTGKDVETGESVTITIEKDAGQR